LNWNSNFSRDFVLYDFKTSKPVNVSESEFRKRLPESDAKIFIDYLGYQS